MNIENYNLKQAFVFSDYNVKVVDKIVYYPIYMLIFLKKDDIDIKLPSIKDLSF